MTRGYATRRPERPPPKFADPLVNNPHAVVEKIAENVTFIHRPPPSAPTPFSTTLSPASPLLQPAASADAEETTVTVPPRMRKQRSHPNSRVLNEEDFEEMRRLRASDPTKYTRLHLAKMFNCAPFLVAQKVPLAAPAHREAVKKVEEEHQKIRSKWVERKALVMAIRKKRRTYW